MFNKKILCLGNNGNNTDIETAKLARRDQITNHGLISSSDYIPQLPGYYHTTVIDIPTGGILQLARQFDTIIFLDQPTDQWTHWKPLLSTYKIMVELDKLGLDTVYKENTNIQKYKAFDTLVTENKSFCIYPWIEQIEEYGHLTLCARSTKKVTTIKELTNWQTDPNYQKIRQSMLKGELLPDHCSYCYNYEAKGIESYRQFETKEWIAKLNINSIEELTNIKHPHYYEVRLSNKCNLMCRSCRPEHSHLIDAEYKKFNIIHPAEQHFKYSSVDHIDISTLTKDTRVYLTGGEPTIMSEVLDFMKNCISLGRTDFDFSLGTNGQKISPKFLELSDHFTNMNFSFSLDGYGKINDYWRWGSDWDTVIKNAHLLKSHGHTISINTVPGIYNVTNLHLLFEFLDREFPHVGTYLQINHVGFQSAYNHPNTKLVVESMEKCKQTQTYHSDGKSTRTAIDSLHSYYSKNPTCNLESLRQFFDYNDQLDHARGVKLADYIPELEACRNLITG
jgi:sulfatase maturation enzyme AslB (radical SAM superfamily)